MRSERAGAATTAATAARWHSIGAWIRRYTGPYDEIPGDNGGLCNSTKQLLASWPEVGGKDWKKGSSLVASQPGDGPAATYIPPYMDARGYACDSVAYRPWHSMAPSRSVCLRYFPRCEIGTSTRSSPGATWHGRAQTTLSRSGASQKATYCRPAP